MRTPADLWLVLALGLSGLVVYFSLRQTFFQLRSARRGVDRDWSGRWRIGPESHSAFLWWLAALTSWVVVSLIAAVLGWAQSPPEPVALALAAMFVAAIARMVITVLYIAPLIVSQRRTLTKTRLAPPAFDLYTRWHATRTMLDVATLLATALALALAIAT